MEKTVTIQEETPNLEMVLVTTSMNHEYAKKELEATQSFHRREELLSRMSHLKTLYFEAREALAMTHPDKLEAIEEELRLQKERVFTENLN